MCAIIPLMFLIGCSAPMPTEPPAPAAVESAIAITWQVYGAPSHWERPAVSFVVGERCINHLVDAAPSRCMDGWYSTDDGSILVGWWTGTLSTSSLAHELYHAFFWRRDKDSDPDHIARGWSFRVASAEQALADAGL